MYEGWSEEALRQKLANVLGSLERGAHRRSEDRRRMERRRDQIEAELRRRQSVSS